MHLLYNIGIVLYGFSIRFASLFNPKAKLWVQGRRFWRNDLRKIAPQIENGFWFHCASLGEFEQGRPLMEALKKQYPNTPLIVSFFSPSGYEIRKKYALADYVCYLPLDTPGNARFFVNLLKPKAVFFVKYEFWTNFLKQVKLRRRPLYLISGNFRSDQRFFTKKNPFYRLALRCFSHFFVQNECSEDLLQGIGFKNVSVCGDTRFDRVHENAKCVKQNDVLQDFINGEDVFILGSTWPFEHQMILPKINDGTIKEKVIIAPHEVDSKSIKEIEAALSVPNFRYSHHDEYKTLAHKRVLILDGIGMLANVYAVGHSAYVGGAFGKGLHNILEPAVYGLPVIFGPHYEKFPEGQEFIDTGIGFSVKNVDEFLEKKNFIAENHNGLKNATMAFMQRKTGATKLIINRLAKDLEMHLSV
jgi:3-deoxy-D-manno-octulosonic-acid transferase